MKFRKNKPYPAYKDSGVEWIGEVPEHWEVLNIKDATAKSLSRNTFSVN